MQTLDRWRKRNKEHPVFTTIFQTRQGTMIYEYKKGYEQGQLDLLEKLMHTEWTYIFDVIGEQYKRLTHDRLSERTTQ